MAGIALYIISRSFQVQEDPRIDRIEDLLPGINCGACGFPGCRGFAKDLVRSADDGDLGELFCPPGGNETMKRIGGYLGFEVESQEETTAVLLCNGSLGSAPLQYRYQGPEKCFVANELFLGENGCAYGCLGYGDCVDSCDFTAMRMDSETRLPEIFDENCVSCGACVKACPRNLIVIWPRGENDRRVWIACRNREKGAVAMKNCKSACIACHKCVKTCNQIASAITMENNLATIHQDKCIRCGECIPVCPTGSILSTFPYPEKTGTNNDQRGEDR